MNSPRRIYTVIVLAVAFMLPAVANVYDVDGVLERLDDAVANRFEYYNKRVAQIDSIVASYSGSTIKERLINLERIGDEYSSFNNDSAIFYFRDGFYEAANAACDSMEIVFRLKLAAHLPVSGFVDYASNIYSRIDTVGMSNDMKFLYYESGRKMNYFIALIYESHPKEHQRWTSRIVDCQLNMIKYQDTDSDIYLKNLGDYYFITNEQGKAWDLLVGLLERLEVDSEVYANTAEILADISEQRGDTEAQKYYLALAASSDIYAAAREVSALQKLAALLFKENDVYRAYEYMSVALENATDCGALARMMEISPQLPIITEAHNKLMDWWTVAYAMIIIILAICIIVIIMFAFFLVRHLKRMRLMQSCLVEANRTKEIYISQFMVLCSMYIDKLIQFNNLVSRKISLGQTDDLYKITKSGKFIEEQTHDFYKIFDDAFLHLYPDFVEEVNSLLLHNEKIILREGERLNTDLRILACQRLGLLDANRIAQILNYSVNTIYAYRNRIRKRAISPDSFESDLMNLGYR